MKVVDAGHTYELRELDGVQNIATLRFVKRCNPSEKYPGNYDAHPGTTVQEVLRACVDRLQYVQAQIPSEYNGVVVHNLECAIWYLEMRAASRHGRVLRAAPLGISKLSTCETCGHIECEEQHGT